MKPRLFLLGVLLLILPAAVRASFQPFNTNTSMNIGIGSATPGQALDVQGTVRATGFTLTTGAAAGSILMADSVGVGTWVAASAVGDGGGVPGGNSNAVQYNNAGVFAGADNNFSFNGTNVGIGTTLTGATGKLNVLGGNVGIGTVAPRGALVVTNGNVGIGTWAPGMALVVDGNVGIGTNRVSANQFLVFNSSAESRMSLVSTVSDAVFTLDKDLATDSAAFTVTSGSFNYSLGAPASDDFSIYNANTPRFLIESDGTYSVGIGTTSAKSQLTVAGNVGIATTTDSPFLTTSAPSGGMIVEGNVGLGTILPQAGLVSMNNAGIGTWTASGGRMIVRGGNVGIGTPWPGQVMDIEGTARMTGFTLTTGAAAGSILMANSVGVGTWIAASAVGDGGGPAAGNPNGVQYSNAGAFAGADNNFSFNGTNVGIGTTLTGATGKLNVMGGNVGIGTAAPRGALVVTNGNVGIGTWAPAMALEINGNVGIGSSIVSLEHFVVYNSSAEAKVRLTSTVSDAGFTLDKDAANDGSSILFQHAGSSYFSFGPPASSNLSVISAGQAYFLMEMGGTYNVGFNTFSARSQLTVAGNVGIATTSDSLFLTTSAPSGGMIVEGNVGLGTILPQAGLVSMNNAGIGTWTASGGRMIVRGGNVGIGTPWPGQAVDIEGTARMTGFTLTTGAAAGSILMANSVGVGTWVAASGVGDGGGAPAGNPNAVQYNNAGVFGGADNNFSFNGTNVGIGTTLTGATGKLNVMGGNVGIGTVAPRGAFTVSNGNVGVGTFAPTVLFQVGADEVNITAGGQIGNNGNAYIGNGSAQFIELQASSAVESSIFFRNGSTDVVRIPAGTSLGAGNVGIGTTIPRGALEVNNAIIFQSEYANTCADGGSVTINWNNGNKQKLTLTDNACSVTLSASGGAANLVLKVVQSAGGSDTITWVTGVLWPSGAAPTLTATGSAADMLSFYYDGTSYYGVASLDLR